MHGNVVKSLSLHADNDCQGLNENNRKIFNFGFVDFTTNHTIKRVTKTKRETERNSLELVSCANR